MNYFILLLALLTIFLLGYKSTKNLRKRKIVFNKKNFYNWMKLTKKERYELNKNDSYDYLNRRKVLLNEIREEYKSIEKKKNNSKRN
ncbi:MAG: glycoprotein [Chloroflexi bacterium]|nr:glycoprotein [Chloroflexota bacterium]